jgi:tRNA-2-methylthio-N6-dimethylallyladenosine synthase
MNVHDSEEMAGILECMGYVPAADEEDADIILLNTCSVREKADQKLFTKLGRIGKLKSRKPHLIVGVCGCIAQREGEAVFRRAPFVDLVLGTRAISRLPILLREVEESGGGRCFIEMSDEIGTQSVYRRSSSVIAYVTIMEGCNNFCSYCIVPFVRGRETSRPSISILAEVEQLADDGYREVHLLGQNVNSYYDAINRTTFAGLLKQVAHVRGISRIRFITSHPKDFTYDIAEVMAEEATVCNAIHLPAQSGSDAVLAAMNRQYTRRGYLDRIEILKNHLKSVSLSSDFIAGFPGESEKDFRQTLNLAEEVGYSQLFTFIYSPRPGTSAAGLEDNIPRAVKVERLIRLQELQNRIQSEKNSMMVGSDLEVLVDGASAKAGGQMTGRTEGNIVVNFDAPTEILGKIVRLRITEAGIHSLRGRIAGELDKNTR